MKKYVYFILLMILAGFVSCSEEETIYSCNEQTNEWVKEHLSTIRNMSRQQCKSLPQSKKTAVFRAFTQNQRLNFWKDKLKETLNLKWTDAEKQHILQLYNFVVNNSDVFTDKEMSEDVQDKYDLFFYEWTTYAEEQLGWDMKTLVSIAGSGEEMLDKSGKLNVKRRIGEIDHKDPIGPDRETCHCNQKYDFCGVPFMNADCVDTGCSGTSVGCGWLLASSCDGRCDNIY